MKKFIFILGMITVFNVQADIEYTSQDASQPTTQEISKNRSCFEELKVQGCGDPGDDYKRFRSCMSDAYDTLSANCQKMMSDLYGKR